MKHFCSDIEKSREKVVTSLGLCNISLLTIMNKNQVHRLTKYENKLKNEKREISKVVSKFVLFKDMQS